MSFVRIPPLLGDNDQVESNEGDRIDGVSSSISVQFLIYYSPRILESPPGWDFTGSYSD